MTPGGFIRARRVRHGMTQAQVAFAAGVDRADLSKYERDEKSLGGKVATRISRAIHDDGGILLALIQGTDAVHLGVFDAQPFFRKNRRSLKDEQKSQIAELVLQGRHRSVQEICRFTGLAYWWVREFAAPLIVKFRKAGLIRPCSCGKAGYHRGPCFQAHPVSPELLQALLSGMSLADIMKQLGVSERKVTRARKHLTPSQQAQRAASRTENIHQDFPAIRSLLLTGFSQAEISCRLKCSTHRVSRAAQRLTGPQQRQRDIAKIAAQRTPTAKPQQPLRDPLYARISASISSAIDPHLRDDIISEIYVAILDGTLSHGAIEAEAKRFINAGFASWANRYGPISLDAPVAPDSDTTRIEMVPDLGALDAFDRIEFADQGALT